MVSGCESSSSSPDIEQACDNNINKPQNNIGGAAKAGVRCGGDSADDDDDDAMSTGGDSLSQKSSSFAGVLHRHSAALLMGLILFLGVATASAFIAIGLTGGKDSHQVEFTRSAQSTIAKIQDSFKEYVDAAAMIHAMCRHHTFDRRDFRELYEYMIDSGLQFKAMQFDPNITHAERPAAEAEARAFYAQHYPHVDYQGFRGFNGNSTSLAPRWNQSFYFPIHYMEPIAGNEAAIDLDYYSSESRTRAVDSLFEFEAPSMTDRLSLVKQAGQVSRCGDHDGPSYGVVLMHPGVDLSDTLLNETESMEMDVWPKDFSSMVICIPDLLDRSTEDTARDMSVYIHDLSHPQDDEVFMGAAEISNSGMDHSTHFLDEASLDEVEGSRACKKEQCYGDTIAIADREWTVTVIDQQDLDTSTIILVCLGGAIILVASLLLAVWVYTNDKRTRRFNQMRSEADAEKASLILQNARQAAKTERELNDFIAHEVRNPVAAAMAATNFVKIEMNKPKPLRDEESITQAKEDISIIDNALHFINDLLRNMLDMHRAKSNQLQISMEPTDLLRDVLEPVAGMLYRGRTNKIQILVDCPENLYVVTDALRLKQVMLNLGRNSQKFIDEGFIRLRAIHNKEDGSVKLSVDDSGSGIPLEKRQRLFTKYQESLDALNQGTGIGLHLCKNLVDLMNGRIYFDEDYDSGVSGHPGTRFVIDLQVDAIEPPALHLPQHDEKHEMTERSGCTDGLDEDMNSLPLELPKKLNVLFVDDDQILRKLFVRSIRLVAPEWSVREAGSGEAALRLVDEQKFDLIFCDMYMASVEKQLLGSETVSELRAKGVDCKICGLSANDKEDEFKHAGADAFLFKPIP
ncbi:MAG: hypothetical protein SGILL_007910, partial [Bacillariaceae sp.]